MVQLMIVTRVRLACDQANAGRWTVRVCGLLVFRVRAVADSQSVLSTIWDQEGFNEGIVQKGRYYLA